MYNSYDDLVIAKIVSILKSDNADYHSIYEMSEALKIDEKKILEQIKKIKELGYKIKLKKGKQIEYKLVDSTNKLLPWEIQEGLNTRLFGRRVYFFNTIDSTQKYALKIASKKKENGAIIIAEQQTKGRGRLKRKWISPQGGIWFSLIIHPDFDVSVSTLFPLAASAALAKSIEKIFKVKTEIKWPNDILIQSNKVAGIITNANIQSNKIKDLVLGVGINFNINAIKIQKLIKKSENYMGVASLVNNNDAKEIKPKTLIQRFLVELEHVCELLERNKIDIIIKELTKRISIIGKDITIINNHRREINGRVIKLDNDGSLLISHNGTIIRMVGDDITGE